MSNILANNINPRSGTSIDVGGTLQVGSATTIHTTGIDLGSGNITSHNINSTGIITATSASFSGNVSIGGTLSYEDVTDIDSVGIITAQSGIHVTGGNVGIGTDNPLRQLDIFSTTHATAALKGDTQSSLFFVDSGDSNIGQISYIHADNYMYFRVNDAERLRISSDGNVSIGGTEPNAFSNYKTLTIGGAGAVDGSGIDLERSDGNIYGRVFADANGLQIAVNQSGDDIRFETSGGTERLRIKSDGEIEYAGSLITFANSGGTVIQTVQPGVAYKQLDIRGSTIVFGVGTGSATERLRITSAGDIDATGHILPTANNTYDLGSVTKGWRNVYSNDLNLSNMNGDSNDIDGTNGSWTIQEGKDDLFLINRLTGKKYKFNLTEVS